MMSESSRSEDESYMGYRHIINLYRPEAQTILLFRRCYALEKIHGTSANVRWHNGKVTLYAGGEKHEKFAALFDEAALVERFTVLGHNTITVYGEAYGGKQQAQAHRYGKSLKFVAFDVLIGETWWLSVPQAAEMAAKLGLEFVHFREVSTDLAELDAERDAPSEQARRNGIEGAQPREGVVLRPLVEFQLLGGDRIMAKHKRAEERETGTHREVGDPAALKVLEASEAIAAEWVTDMRLQHVLSHLQTAELHERDTGRVVLAMVEDVVREGAGEFVDSREARKAIGTRTAQLFQRWLKTSKEQK